MTFEQLQPSATIGDVKVQSSNEQVCSVLTHPPLVFPNQNLISTRCDIPVDKQALVHRRENLADDKTVTSLNLGVC